MRCKRRLLCMALIVLALGCENKKRTANQETNPDPAASDKGRITGRIRSIAAEKTTKRWMRIQSQASLALGQVVLKIRPDLAKKLHNSATQEERDSIWVAIESEIRALGMILDQRPLSGDLLLARSPQIEQNLNAFLEASLRANESNEGSDFSTIDNLYALTHRKVEEASVRPSSTFLWASPNYLRRTNQNPSSPDQWPLDLLEMNEVWQKYQNEFQVRPIVAVIDTGLGSLNTSDRSVRTHPLLRNDVLVPGYDFIEDVALSGDLDRIRDADPSEPGQPAFTFHGTHVAGIVAGHEGQLQGIDAKFFGMGGPRRQIRVMPLRVLGREGVGNDFDVAQAILFAAGLPNASGQLPQAKAEIINLSLGGGGQSPVLKDAIEKASKEGVIIVASSGNEGSSSPSYPAAYPEALGVGAYGPSFARASYSNFGLNVDIMAPGGGMGRTQDGILSTWVRVVGSSSQDVLSYMVGTSMASPHIAGIIALAKAMYPQASAAEIRTALLSTAQPIPGCNEVFCGKGSVNVDAFLAEVLRLKTGHTHVRPKVVLSTDEFFVEEETSNQTILIDNIETSINLISTGEIRITGDALTEEDQSRWLEAELIEKDEDLELTLHFKKLDLPSRTYTGIVTIPTNASEVRINTQVGDDVNRSGFVELFVYYQIGDGANPEAPSRIHVVLVHPEKPNSPILQTSTTREKNYEYVLEAVPNGSYLLKAGSDENQNGVICEVGEYCGAYRDRWIPVTLQVKSDVLQRSFSILPNFDEKQAISLGGEK